MKFLNDIRNRKEKVIPVWLWRIAFFLSIVLALVPNFALKIYSGLMIWLFLDIAIFIYQRTNNKKENI